MAGVFALATLLIGVSGTRLAGLADRLADRTGLGEAVVGGVFLGVSTSLPGITASVTAAIQGRPELAVSNAAGGIAVQTAFLAVADLFYRRGNLEHAAASAPNLVQAVLLIGLLSMPLLAASGPEISLGPVHPVTPLLVLAYLAGLRLVTKTGRRPMWRPERTSDTVEDLPDPQAQRESLAGLIAGFGAVAALVMASGVAVAQAGAVIADRTGLSETVVGGLFTAVSTSLPELATAVAAVRRGALTLAVGDIVGGNAFDVLFLCAADVAWTGGSLYHAAGPRPSFFLALAILLNAVLLLGLLHRERRGVANIGFESATILVVYVAAVILVGVAG